MKFAAECNNGTLDSVVSACGTRSLASVSRLFACYLVPLINARWCFQSETPLCLVGGVCLPFSCRYRLRYYPFLIIPLYSFSLSTSLGRTSLPLFLYCVPPSPLTSTRHGNMAPVFAYTRGCFSACGLCYSACEVAPSNGIRSVSMSSRKRTRLGLMVCSPSTASMVSSASRTLSAHSCSASKL